MAPNDFGFNGVDATTGEYLVPSRSPQDIARIARGEAAERIRIHRPVVHGVDESDLASSGWGVVFAQGLDPAVRSALAPLLDRRLEQAGRDRYREYVHLSDETAREFLNRQKIGPGVADPSRVPYYLLLVGGPEAIPFQFQYQLDLQYAVGRLHFTDVEGYTAYARSVVRTETGSGVSRPRIVLFGVENEDDQATENAGKYLVCPLAERLGAGGFNLQLRSGSEASKTNLGRLLGGEETPDLLFTVSHGIGFPAGHPLQLAEQGALLCGNWPGPRAWRERIPREFYFTADDIQDDTCLSGLVSFHFACHSGGTPQCSPLLPGRATPGQAALAPHDFVAALPQRLLSHPRGALAAIGHIDRAWDYSFLWDRMGSQPQAFESALKRVLEGLPVGYAMEFFNARHAELASELLDLLESGGEADDEQLAAVWTARNDARGYVVFGDPAVRLKVSGAQRT